jgi:hypothetical protein
MVLLLVVKLLGRVEARRSEEIRREGKRVRGASFSQVVLSFSEGEGAGLGTGIFQTSFTSERGSET